MSVNLRHLRNSLEPFDCLNTGGRLTGMFAQFKLLAEKVLEDPSLCSDPKFMSNEARVKNRMELVKIISDKLTQHYRDYLLKRLTGLGYVLLSRSSIA